MSLFVAKAPQSYNQTFVGADAVFSQFLDWSDYKRVQNVIEKKVSPFKIVKITENLSFLGQRWHLVTLGDTFFSKASPFKITILFEDLNFLTQRWRFWWKYLPLGFHMRFFRKEKIQPKIFYYNRIGCCLSIKKLNCSLTILILSVDTFEKNWHLCMTVFQL